MSQAPSRPPRRVPPAVPGYVSGCAVALAGVFLQWGLPVLLMVAGVVIAASFVLAFAGESR